MLIKHSRSEKDALTRVVFRVSCQLALGQLKHRMSLIQQSKLILDFRKNSDSVVYQNKLNASSGFLNLYTDVISV